SVMVREALTAAAALAPRGLDCEVIDLRSIKPWDVNLVLESVRRTGRLVIADAAWRTAGVAAEIAATIGELAFDNLRAPIARVTLPDAPLAASRPLEQAYFIDAQHVIRAIEEIPRLRKQA
ncbi:MAG: transketolase C-terminal domain-containing protein, partial [Candidatus Binataceae bacterium]